MTANDSARHRAPSSALGRTARKRWVPYAAATTAAALTVAAIATAGGGSAGASGTLPQAQSVGNFLNATLGGSTLDSVAKLKYASAQAPGTQSVQNPLDATVLNALNLPLTGALQLPQLLGIKLGAVNQVATAHTDGSSYGGSGAVNNSGGVSVGGNNNAFPANATIDLSASGIAGNSPVSLPGGSTADALGGVKVSVGAVSALAQTPTGYGKAASTTYQIAGLNIQLGSPALGKLLGGVLSAVTGVLGQVATAAGAVTTKLTGCDLTSGTVPSTLSLDNGAVVIDPANAAITIDLEALLKTLGLDLNKMAPNTDLIDYLLAYLVSPNGLAKGITSLINGLVDPLETQYTACKASIQAIPVLGPTLTTLLDTLISGQTTLENTISQLTGSLAGAAGATNPLAPLADLLKKLVDIGVNVQPNGPAGPTNAAYVDPLQANAKQDTPVVKGQTVVRAIEVNVAAASGASLPGLGSLPGLPTLPGLGSVSGSALKAAATSSASSGNTGILTLALANAAAGPSNAPAPSTTTAPPTTHAPTAVPTKIPAGMGTHGGSPVLPIALLLLGLVFAGGGVLSYRLRGRLNQH